MLDWIHMKFGNDSRGNYSLWECYTDLFDHRANNTASYLLQKPQLPKLAADTQRQNQGRKQT